MPTAGDEGYEKLIPCPYDKAHEIRKGRMQFHLEKCRRNFPMTQLVDCPYNKGHLVPKQELEYHMEEECESRATWERFTYETATMDCPVRDLVPVNAGTVPDGEENWDNFESSGSVLSHIKAEAENKPIVRMCQVASKATRKAFRAQERRRFSEFAEAEKSKPDEKAMSDTASVVSNLEPLPRPRRQPNVLVVKQDPSKAVAAINKQFRTLDLNIKAPTGNVAPSDTSSMINGPPSEFETASTSRQMPFSYATASKAASRPPSAMSNFSTGNSSTSMMTALTSQKASDGNMYRPTTSMSGSTFSSFTTASQGATDRPPSAMSNTSAGDSTVSSMPISNIRRPPNSATSRPSTAMSIAASAALYKRAPPVDEEGFCQVPIPGLGRGKRKPLE